MNIQRLLCAATVCASMLCSAQQINPITKAVLDGYGEILKENPKDYFTLYERAAQYYRLNLYDNALNDITKAIEYTPAKESDLRLSEFSLLADVAIETKDYELALKAIDEALSLAPSNYANVYKKGNILLYLNRPEDAYRTFSSMQSLKSRSQEAYFGMAKACIMQKNFTEAQDLMKEAEAADPTNYLTFCRIGDLYMDMEQPENAATNYLVGFTMAKDSSRPLESLISLADTNYNAVATALDFAAEKADNKIPILFLKGNIACESGNYSQAEDAFGRLLAFPDARVASVYAQQARARLGLNDLKGAETSINNALDKETSADYYILKSEIDAANGTPAQAVIDATNAINIEPDNTEALVAHAEAQIVLKDAKGALESLNRAIMIQPDNLKALLLRAYVNQNLADNGKAAVGDFNRIILETPESFPGLAIKGIAQAKTGKKLDADATIEKGLGSNPGKDALYWAAVYYAQTGDLEKAHDLAGKAVYAGYQNRFNLQSADTPWLTLAPIRHLMK